ncbi:MAG: ferritin [Melioribacteraceae bacterium]|jgi:ferritin|nr:ferritin [Melioribacteraceae bacterium]WKZ68299.1 MAG: ferritin [Melioribacteraceae bacterium]
MISKKMQDALNKQLNAELFSSYLYLSMAAHFENTNMRGFAHWMSQQSTEEYTHAMKFYTYLNSVGAKVDLQAIDKPKGKWTSPKQAFEEALTHEKKITKMINDLADLALTEKDHSTNIFLHWFVTEQVEEVSSVEDIVNKFEMIGDNKNGLFLLDRELGSRQ